MISLLMFVSLSLCLHIRIIIISPLVKSYGLQKQKGYIKAGIHSGKFFADKNGTEQILWLNETDVHVKEKFKQNKSNKHNKHRQTVIQLMGIKLI